VEAATYDEAMRSYGDPCGVARALDLVGDRWALLVVRELLLGPKRFTDVLAGLPGASPNVLAHRLRALEDAGVLRRRKLEPPAAAWVYDLTERGRELEPVLLALGRWGSPLPSPPDTEFGVDAMMFALKTLFDSRAVGRLRARYQVTLGSERFKVEIAKGRLDIVRGAAAEVDAVIDTDIPTLRSVVFGRLQLGKAQKQGRLRIEGDREAATKLFESFIPVETSPH
jgi:DNA-binding HxlR family transcriptional regulator